MANKAVTGNYFLPDNIKNQLQTAIDKGHGGKNRRRIIGYLNDGHITDREIAKLLYDYKNNNLGQGEDLGLIEKLIKWAQREIGGKAEHIYRTKKSQSDIGIENKHKKTHFKWGDDTKPIRFHNLIDIPKPTKMFESETPVIKTAIIYNEDRYNIIKKILSEGLNLPKMTPQSWFKSILNRTTGPYTTPQYPRSLFYKLDGDVIFEYNKTNGHFFVDYDTIGSVFHNRFGVEYDETQELIKSMVEEHYKLGSVTPRVEIFTQWSIGGRTL